MIEREEGCSVRLDIRVGLGLGLRYTIWILNVKSCTELAIRTLRASPYVTIVSLFDVYNNNIAGMWLIYGSGLKSYSLSPV